MDRVLVVDCEVCFEPFPSSSPFFSRHKHMSATAAAQAPTVTSGDDEFELVEKSTAGEKAISAEKPAPAAPPLVDDLGDDAVSDVERCGIEFLQ